MLKGFNKRGQDLPVGALVLIVLGVLVLVGLGWIFFSGTNKVTDTLNQAPGGVLEAAVQGCELAAKGELYVDYCTTFKKISSKDYINCEDSRLDAGAQRTKLTCDDSQVAESAIQFCKDQKFGNDVVVAGTSCANVPKSKCSDIKMKVGNTEYTASWVDAGACQKKDSADSQTYTPKTSEVQDLSDRPKTDSVCCVIVPGS